MDQTTAFVIHGEAIADIDVHALARALGPERSGSPPRPVVDVAQQLGVAR
jgi:hypothetical protein